MALHGHKSIERPQGKNCPEPLPNFSFLVRFNRYYFTGFRNNVSAPQDLNSLATSASNAASMIMRNFSTEILYQFLRVPSGDA